MKDLHYSIEINAPRERVWNTMLEDSTYRQWTNAFMPGSYYEGDWSEGSEMRFLGPSEGGQKDGGMAARVKENRHLEFISLEQYAEIRDGELVPWNPTGFENYTFTDSENGTLLSIDLLGIPDEYAGMFDEMWPKALQILEEITEA
jgi:uncharacterized protein YndB with AHSA1/START domain